MEYIEGATLDKFLASNPSRSARERVLHDILDGVEYLHHRGLLHNDLKPQNIIVNRYGAARIIDFGLSASDDSLWSGCVGGSDAFSAPEILNGKGSAGATSDIYSVGRLVEHIFERGRYARVVARCVDERPEHRYGSIVELRHALARHRRRPLFAAGTILVVGVALALTLPTIEKNRNENHQNEEEHHPTEARLEISKAVNHNFTTTSKIVNENQYSEFAVMAQGLYMIEFDKYRATLPSEHRLFAEEIFVEHLHHFDSLINNLPTINKLPAPKQDSLRSLLEELSLKILQPEDKKTYRFVGRFFNCRYNTIFQV
jgi:serine/threonine protein kinase